MDAILIVDDVKANRILLTQMVLKMRDFIIFEAVNGKEAIVQFEQKKPDLILMDINMPEMDGYLSSQAIKEKAGNNYIPIIFITALIETASLDNAIAAGGDDFLSKPFDFNLLESKITAHLRIRALNQQLCKKISNCPALINI